MEFDDILGAIYRAIWHQEYHRIPLVFPGYVDSLLHFGLCGATYGIREIVNSIRSGAQPQMQYGIDCHQEYHWIP